MGVESFGNFIANNNVLICFLLIIGFGTWKLIIQPIANDGAPIEPTQDQIDGPMKDIANPDISDI